MTSQFEKRRSCLFNLFLKFRLCSFTDCRTGCADSHKAEALSAPHGVDAMVFVMRSGRITDDVIARCLSCKHSSHIQYVAQVRRTTTGTWYCRLIYATEYLWGTECLLNLYIVVTYGSRYVWETEGVAKYATLQSSVQSFDDLCFSSGCMVPASLRTQREEAGLNIRVLRHGQALSSLTVI